MPTGGLREPEQCPHMMAIKLLHNPRRNVFAEMIGEPTFYSESELKDLTLHDIAFWMLTIKPPRGGVSLAVKPTQSAVEICGDSKSMWYINSKSNTKKNPTDQQ